MGVERGNDGEGGWVELLLDLSMNADKPENLVVTLVVDFQANESLCSEVFAGP